MRIGYYITYWNYSNIEVNIVKRYYVLFWNREGSSTVAVARVAVPNLKGMQDKLGSDEGSY